MLVRSGSILAAFLMLVCHSGQSAAEEKSVAAQTYLANLSNRLTQSYPQAKTINIVCHGHSVPAGFFKTPVVDTFNAYPHLLHVALKQRHPHAIINVINTAVGGENSVSGEARFEKEVLTHQPDLITIDYALNDRGLGVARARQNLASMIDKAQTQNILVLLLTPTPDHRANLNDPADPLNQQAEMIRSLAAEKGVGLVDSYAAFKAKLKEGVKLDDLMSQVNHPNRAGHELVTLEMLKWFP